MAAAKGTTKAKASAASVAASSTTQENGASAPSSLESGVVGALPAMDAASGNGNTTGDSDGAGESATGVDLAPGNDGAVGSGDGASGEGGADLPGDGAAGDQRAADASGGAAGDSVGAGDLPGDVDGGALGDSQSLTGADGEAQAAQAAALALSAGGVGNALLALLDAAESEQTPSENGPAEPVISTAWAMPEIGTFPAHITIQNNTPSRVVVLKVRLDPHASVDGGIDEEGYARLSKSLASHARLGKWDNLLGVQVKHDSKD